MPACWRPVLHHAHCEDCDVRCHRVPVATGRRWPIAAVPLQVMLARILRRPSAVRMPQQFLATVFGPPALTCTAACAAYKQHTLNQLSLSRFPLLEMRHLTCAVACSIQRLQHSTSVYCNAQSSTRTITVCPPHTQDTSRCSIVHSDAYSLPSLHTSRQLRWGGGTTERVGTVGAF